MKIAIIGATGGTGRKVMERALALGHEVVAVARRPEVISPIERLSTRQGDVFDASSIAKAIAGTDVVISCIGPSSNFSPGAEKKGLLNIRAARNVMAANFSPGTVMSEGIPNMLAACERAGVKRLVMQSGINLTDGKELSAVNRWAVGIMRRIFWKAIEDKSIAEHAVIGSDLEWVIVRASALKYAGETLKYRAGPSARIAPLQALSYADCADCLVRAATSEPSWIREIVNVGR
ncbi:NAD(P)-dependent oxidoreductase [Paenibacillus paeoniae]|uniref:NAD-dependent epimerase/dehydratase family protein n=1 Tax=Paenibacillus paeoniae TaxID=2292705 RepID=A0A371PER5_9BACL|nr:NAD(P)H-binding protein [Paenibacillus paeoniae]REK74441.1 NAD-dependent epimerase/dehydratase family protein [Paenibacillus paeoniae]